MDGIITLNIYNSVSFIFISYELDILTNQMDGIITLNICNYIFSYIYLIWVKYIDQSNGWNYKWNYIYGTHGTTGDPPPRALQMGCYENKAFKVSKFIAAERKLQRNKVFCQWKRNPYDLRKKH